MPTSAQPKQRAMFAVLDERGAALAVSDKTEGRLPRSVLMMDSRSFSSFKTEDYARKAIRSTAAYATAQRLPWAAEIPKWTIVPITVTRT